MRQLAGLNKFRSGRFVGLLIHVNETETGLVKIAVNIVCAYVAQGKE